MLSAIGIVSKDIRKSIEFYENFGMEFKSFGEGDHFEAQSNGVRIMIDTYELMKKINPNFEMPEKSKVSLCFDLKTKEAVDKMFKQLTSQGSSHTKEPWDAFWGQRYAVILDPSGNQVELFASL